MDITIHASFLPHNDPEASLAFYRDTLGFEVRDDVGNGTMRWSTVDPVDRPYGVSRRRLPRSRRQPDPHPAVALSRRAVAGPTDS